MRGNYRKEKEHIKVFYTWAIIAGGLSLAIVILGVYQIL